MYANRRNFRIFKKIWVEEHYGDVIFLTGSGNAAVSCMRNRNASRHNYRNSLVIVDLAMGQIPRSAERISSYSWICWPCLHTLSQPLD